MSNLTKLTFVLASPLTLFFSSYSVAQIRSIDDCAVHQKTEMREGCLGTGINGDRARDPYLTFYNQCNVKIGIKVCFSFPDGSMESSTEYLSPGETERIYRCTKKGSYGRLQPSPDNYYVWNTEDGYSGNFRCN